MFVYALYAQASFVSVCFCVRQSDTAPETRAHPPATWRPPQTRSLETADKAPPGLPTNSPQHTHSWTCSSYMYPWPVCPSSVISFVSAHSLQPQKRVDGETCDVILWLVDYGFKASSLASEPLPSWFFDGRSEHVLMRGWS